MKTVKTGSVDTNKTVKAGCGIRYDPKDLTVESGFDFSQAVELKSSLDKSTRDNNASAENEHINGNYPKKSNIKDSNLTN